MHRYVLLETQSSCGTIVGRRVPYAICVFNIAGGNLATVISQDDNLPENCIRQFGADIVKGLHHVHSLGIIFSDLKPSKVWNCQRVCFGLCLILVQPQVSKKEKLILLPCSKRHVFPLCGSTATNLCHLQLLLDGPGVVKLAGFGLSRVEGENLAELFAQFIEMAGDEWRQHGEDDTRGNNAQATMGTSLNVFEIPFGFLLSCAKIFQSRIAFAWRLFFKHLQSVGSLAYMSPEVIQSGEYSMASDLWSLGCVFFEMFTGQFSHIVNVVFPKVKGCVLQGSHPCKSLAAS